jgi:hypothetical protein
MTGRKDVAPFQKASGCPAGSVEEAGWIRGIFGWKRGSLRERSDRGSPLMPIEMGLASGEGVSGDLPRFKPPWTPGGGGLAYGMAGAATRCTHIDSRIPPHSGVDQGGLWLAGRARERDRKVGGGAFPGDPARECER